MKTLADVEIMFEEKGYSQTSAPYFRNRAFEFKKYGENMFKQYNFPEGTKNDIREIASKIEVD